MQVKQVFFGRVGILQVECPECKTWQFESKECCECGLKLSGLKKEKGAKEYRSEIPGGKRFHISDKRKKEIFERDNYVCQYCGIYRLEDYILDNNILNIDHMLPISGGGADTDDNLITSCRECNLIKGSKRFKTFDDAREFILKRKKDYKHNKHFYENL